MNYILAFVVLLLSIPLGYFLRGITKEELRSGKKYFFIIWVGCVVLLMGFLLVNSLFEETLFYVFSFLFIGVVSFISWR